MEESIRLKAKPKEVEAIKWDNNEAFIRNFIRDDRLLRFPDGKLEVWNKEEKCWMNVPHAHYVIRGIKGELYPISYEVMTRSYEIIG